MNRRLFYCGSVAAVLHTLNASAQDAATPSDAVADEAQLSAAAQPADASRISAPSAVPSAPGTEVPTRPATPKVLQPGAVGGQSLRKPSNIASRAVVEMGFVGPVAHSIQFGKLGTRFDYVKDGGQDVLFPTLRASIEATFAHRHTLIFLYQPIDLRTTERLRDDLLVDDVRFPAGTPVDFRYGFDFYRLSYLYDLAAGGGTCELSVGASLQLRNAVIDFTSADGLLRRTNRGVGPVPALKSRGRVDVGKQVWIGYEVDGMYAPVKFINGGKSDVVGAILDASLRVGYEVARPIDLFFNIRYLGGGAKGTSKGDAERGPGDGYTSNWLHFVSSTVGVSVRLEPLFERSQRALAVASAR